MVSNSSTFRMRPDVPLVIPEVNPDHIKLLECQPWRRKSGGFIVTNSNCSAMGLVVALAPLQKHFGLEQVIAVTMQAVSGAGYPGVPALDILQPSLLLGERKSARPMEVMGSLFAPLVNPFLTGAREVWRPIPAEKVARAMVGAARRGARGIYRHTYASIQQLAQSKSVQPQAKAAPGGGPA